MQFSSNRDEKQSENPLYVDTMIKKVEELMLEDAEQPLMSWLKNLKECAAKDSIHIILANDLKYQKITFKQV